jgi:transcriptional regulator of arginine metabolism
MKNIYSSRHGLRRRSEILRLVQAGWLRSQEDIRRGLRQRGIAVAQPTLSRDVKALGLAKTPAGYVTSPSAQFVPAERRHQALERALREFALSVRVAASLVVIRTPPAGAHPLARVLDEADVDDVVGTIAGDDTVFVATPGPGAAVRLEKKLHAPLARRRATQRTSA